MLVVTISLASFESLPPKIIKYRNWKSFDEDKFRCLFKKCLKEFKADGIIVDSSVKWTVLVHSGFQPRGQNFQTQI